MAVIIIVFSTPILNAFMSDAEIVRLGSLMLKIMTISTPFTTVVLICTVLFQSAGKASAAMMLSVGRQGLIFIPAIFILQKTVGYYGVISSQTAADMLTFVLGLILLKVSFKVFFSEQEA